MEIGYPTNVLHVTHVTFDRFNGFFGFPVEFEPEVTRRAPSARGNNVPTILILMQHYLYAQGGLQAWFRELTAKILDSLSFEHVMQCQTEKECDDLIHHLPPNEASLLDWAINLMADVVQQEHFNKMDARNIAMVFAPNMTQMADPLTALMYVVQVMKFLMMLILRTLRGRKDSILDSTSTHFEPSNESGH